MFDNLELKEWNRIVLGRIAIPPGASPLDEPTWDVFDELKTTFERCGYLSVNDLQRFNNHEHPSFGIGEEECILEQVEGFQNLQSKFKNEFPDLTFVVEIDWLFKSTWYQLLEGSPSLSEEWTDVTNSFYLGDFQLLGESENIIRQVLVERSKDAKAMAGENGCGRFCRHCSERNWISAWEDTGDRIGIVWMQCGSCGQKSVEATRIIRLIVGNGEPRKLPRFPWDS